MALAAASEPVESRLLAIAADQLRHRGARGVTVVGVAEAAGMTHANVYRYFPSRAALIDAVLAQWLKGLEAGLADIASAPDPADDKLERLLVAVAHSHRDLLRRDPSLFGVHVDAIESSRAVVRRYKARQRQLIDRVVDEGIATGLFDPQDRDRALSFVTDVLFRFINPVAIRLDSEMPDEMFAERLAAIIRAIRRVLITGIL
jgi:AcrR family transcriptional regulator